MNISQSNLAKIAAICMALSGPGAATAQGLPILSVEALSVPEFARTYPIVVKINTPSPADVTGRLSADGSTRHDSGHTALQATPGVTCENGVDFIPLVDQPFVIPAGQLRTTLETLICGDRVVEENEHFLVGVNRESLVGARCETGLRDRCSHAPDIINNDDPTHDPAGMRIFDVLVTEPRTGTIDAELTVQLARTSAHAVTVNYKTVAGTASDRGRGPQFRPRVSIRNPDACSERQLTQGFGLKRVAYYRDYLPRSGTVTIAANTDRATIAIPICVDPFAEGQEHFFVVITSTAEIARGRALVSIQGKRAAN